MAISDERRRRLRQGRAWAGGGLLLIGLGWWLYAEFSGLIGGGNRGGFGPTVSLLEAITSLVTALAGLVAAVTGLVKVAKAKRR